MCKYRTSYKILEKGDKPKLAAYLKDSITRSIVHIPHSDMSTRIASTSPDIRSITDYLELYKRLVHFGTIGGGAVLSMLIHSVLSEPVPHGYFTRSEKPP